MKENYETAMNDDIVVRVNLERSSSVVQYRLNDGYDEDWKPTIFQRAEFIGAKDALNAVDSWLS